MSKFINFLKNMQIKLSFKKVLSTALVGFFLFFGTACSSVQAKANAPTADQVRDELPRGETYSQYKGGMNGYSDVDPRFDASAAKAKAKGLVDNAERNVIDQTDDLATNTKRILDKKGQNVDDLGDNLQESSEYAKNEAKRSARDFARGTEKGTDNIKNNASNATSDLSRGVSRAGDKIDRVADNVEASIKKSTNN